MRAHRGFPIKFEAEGEKYYVFNEWDVAINLGNVRVKVRPIDEEDEIAESHYWANVTRDPLFDEEAT